METTIKTGGRVRPSIKIFLLVVVLTVTCVAVFQSAKKKNQQEMENAVVVSGEVPVQATQVKETDQIGDTNVKELTISIRPRLVIDSSNGQ